MCSQNLEEERMCADEEGPGISSYPEVPFKNFIHFIY